MNYFADVNKDLRNFRAGAVTLSKRNVSTLEGIIILALDTNQMELSVPELLGKCNENGYRVTRPELAVTLDWLDRCGFIMFKPRDMIELIPQTCNYIIPNELTKTINRAIDAQYYATTPTLIFNTVTTRLGEVTAQDVMNILTAKGIEVDVRVIIRYANKLCDCGLFDAVKLSGAKTRYRRIKGVAFITKQEKI